MAHIAKYKAPAVGKLCAHYTRWQGIDRPDIVRENIDKERTHLNYVIGTDGASWNVIKARIDAVQESAGKKVRKDAVVMADIVVTAPRNVPERDLERFFEGVYEYLAAHVGADNMLGGYVHMDETTPHMHAPFTPIKDGKFNFKGLCPRSFYQQFHKGLGDFLESRMGYRPEIELPDERKAEKVLSAVPQSDLDVARAAIMGPLEQEREELELEIEEARQRLESVRRAEAEERIAVEQVERRIESLRAHIDEMRQKLRSAIMKVIEKGRSALPAVVTSVKDVEKTRSARADIVVGIPPLGLFNVVETVVGVGGKSVALHLDQDDGGACAIDYAFDFGDGRREAGVVYGETPDEAFAAVERTAQVLEFDFEYEDGSRRTHDAPSVGAENRAAAVPFARVPAREGRVR